MLKFLNRKFSAGKVIPRFERFGEVKLNIKEMVNDLVWIKSNAANRKSSNRFIIKYNIVYTYRLQSRKSSSIASKILAKMILNWLGQKIMKLA